VRAAKRWLPWVGLLVVLAVALIIGATAQHHDASLDAHVRRVASQVKCPTCEGQSAADSNAAASQAIRDDIRTRIEQGETDGAIKAFLVSRYGTDILLVPSSRGVSALVWALPVTAFVLAVGGLALAFRKWRVRAGAPPSDEDRALVDEALRT
jgi:cytochrome c-type biogenesis protein CcmH